MIRTMNTANRVAIVAFSNVTAFKIYHARGSLNLLTSNKSSTGTETIRTDLRITRQIEQGRLL